MSLNLNEFMEATEICPVIPAVKNDEWLKSLNESDSELVYVLYGDICNIAEIVDYIKSLGKKAIVHVDLIVGLANKEISVDFIKKYTQADGIISMKPAIIKRAHEMGIFTIQRFYTMDALSYANVIKHAKHSDPDIVELMPAGLTKILGYVQDAIDKPIIASGLIMDNEEVIGALKAGALAVTTTNKTLWDC